jgi:IS5 family transposase
VNGAARGLDPKPRGVRIKEPIGQGNAPDKRVEHVFGAQTNDMGGTLVRTIGLVRAKAKIGMKNPAYNMRRLVQLRR